MKPVRISSSAAIYAKIYLLSLTAGVGIDQLLLDLLLSFVLLGLFFILIDGGFS
jgi:hypothetical protein